MSPTPITTKKFKVAICGAGIGGLTLAVALMQYSDIDVEIFEGAKHIGEVGAGIGVYPRVWKILQSLGLEEELLKYTEAKRADEDVPGFIYRKADQPLGHDIFRMVVRGGPFMFHRADFHAVLLRKIRDRYPVHTSKRLRSYTQFHSSATSSGTQAPITLSFEDGSSSACDLLVGADGMHSAVRRRFLSNVAELYMQEENDSEAKEALDGIEPKWTGHIAYRAVVPAEALATVYPGHRTLTTGLLYMGKGATIVAYPIQHGQQINIVFFNSRHELENTELGDRPMSMECKNTDIESLFQSWEPEVKALLAYVLKSADTLMDWAIHTVKPLRSFVSGHACLLGDAAHAMTTFQAAGAGQAIEDAFVLSAVLGHSSVTLANVTTALTAYDDIRRPFSLDIQARSRQNGRWMTLHEGSLENFERNVMDNWNWAWETSPNPMLDQAISLLEARLAGL